MLPTTATCPKTAALRDRILARIGIVFLSAQGLLVVHAQLGETRYFAWAPHTTQVEYRIEVVVDGRRLSADEVASRYQVRAHGWEAHAAANLIALVAQYEMSYGVEDRAEVLVRYQINGTEERTWTWPNDR